MSIKLKNINKTYINKTDKNIEALKNVNLSIKKGEMIAIQGVSGSGKSTLLGILGCVIKPDSGEYIYNDVEIIKLSSKEQGKLRNQIFGNVFQSYELLEDINVFDNLMIPLLIQKKKKKEISSMINSILFEMNIEDLKKRKIRNLSCGQKQRVAIARALVGGADIIFADEPTASIDSKMSFEIMKLFVDLNKKGKTIVIATHDPIVLENCEKKYNIIDGVLSPI